MTSRLPGWRDTLNVQPHVQEVVAPVVVQEPVESVSGRKADLSKVTGAMIDESVDNVVRDGGYSSDVAEVFRSLMSRDVAGPIAAAYYSSKAATERSRLAGIVRKELVIRWVLTDDEITALTEYAPEYKLKFLNRDDHDHAAAAACRLVDHKLCRSKAPLGVSLTDIGANPLFYIDREDAGVHCCGPVVDVKDPSRHRLREMQAKVICSRFPGTVRASMARMYLDRVASFVCGKTAMECQHQSKVLTSIHVYDIPMEDWPAIMVKKGAVLVEGCMLFSDKFFEETEGELAVSGARYEIDVRANRFRMGFKSSPSWWYEHDLDKYLRYGTDQVLVARGVEFSYKVVERRGDTLFFRILRLENRPSRGVVHSAYRTPGVKMVKVQGFELADQRFRGESLRPRTYHFPLNLWYEMVSQAAEDYERGVMDYHKMYNHYRTVSVRHTINAVLVMGGEPVSAELLVPLVVHACLAAAAQCVVGRRTTHGITAAAMYHRDRRDESTVSKLLRVFTSFSRSVVLAPFYPIKLLLQVLNRKHASLLEEWLVEWEPVCEIVIMDVKPMMVVTHGLVRHDSGDTEFLRNAAVESAPTDHFSAIVANEDLARLAKQLCPQLDFPVSPVVGKQETVGVVKKVTPPPSYVTNAQSEDEEVLRKSAIREHIEEIKMENKATTYICADVYRNVTIRGDPHRDALKMRAELYHSPDLWLVSNGLIVKSALGRDVEGFDYSAVYHPKPDPDTGMTLRSVFRRDWEGTVSGKFERHVNRCLADTTFNGWVLVVDQLVVHNGPEIVRSLEMALTLPHRYEVCLNWGPPGCGKTYQIVNKFEEGCVDGTKKLKNAVMCPVRESVEDTRGKLVSKFPSLVKPWQYIRTVDSYLTNLLDSPPTKALRARTLLMDECFMAHSARIYAAAALLGVEFVVAFGDDKQIPHIPRVQAPRLHVRLKPSVIEEEWKTRRCPPSAVAAWGSVYSWKVRTLNVKPGHYMRQLSDAKGLEIPTGCVMMCMYQADKKELRKRYASSIGKIKIITAHEAEGKTYDHVWLHRFDVRRRTDKLSLFDQEPHVVVAMSRHRIGFSYIRPVDVGDLVSRWVERGKDVRRLAAVVDVTTEGKEVEFG